MLNIELENEIKSELAALKEARKDDLDNARRAIRSLSYALKESQHYYESTIQKEAPDPVTETQLVLYWKAAAISMKRLRNKRMAQICSEPRPYFINPKHWISEYKKGNKKDFSELIATLSNAVGVSNRSSWKNPKV